MEVVIPVKSQCKIAGNDEVSIITVTLPMLQTSPDQFHVFKAGLVFPILGSILPFCIHN